MSTVSEILDTLSDEVVFSLMDELVGRLILGAWVEDADSLNGEAEFTRRRPGHERSAVKVFRSWPGRFIDGGYCQTEGWYYHVQIGVVDLHNHCNSSNPFPTAEAAKSYVDEQLRAVPGAIVVGGVQ